MNYGVNKAGRRANLRCDSCSRKKHLGHFRVLEGRRSATCKRCVANQEATLARKRRQIFAWD